MSYPTLCQDCLAEIMLPDMEALFSADSVAGDGNHLCHCGGDVCNCSACLSTLSKLKSGVRDYRELSLQSSIDDMAWSPAKGLFKKGT